MTTNNISGNALSMNPSPGRTSAAGAACTISGRIWDARTSCMTAWLSDGHAAAARPVAVNHVDIAQIDRDRHGLSQHQLPSLQVHGIGKADEPAADAHIPEGERHHAVAGLLAALFLVLF